MRCGDSARQRKEITGMKINGVKYNRRKWTKVRYKQKDLVCISRVQPCFYFDVGVGLTSNST